ncbi:MAG: hypothetical protein P4L87_18565, partial [Formivibrio sp.]|nr:hypothetical protein [Formivibrio sp.]
MKNLPLHLLLPAIMSLGVALGVIVCRQIPGAGADTASNFKPKCTGRFVLSSSAVTNGGALPVEFTGDGNSSTLPL